MDVINNFTENGISTNDSKGNFIHPGMGHVGKGEEEEFYSPLFGMKLAMPEWEAIITIVAMGTVIVTTIIGKYISNIYMCYH